MKKTLYLECNSGISGDMSVAALLDLGADEQVLRDALASLPLSGYQIEIKEVFKSGIRSLDFDVILEKDNHDHDMAYLHGEAAQEHAADGHVHITAPDDDHEHGHEHTHEHTHEHSHEHTHEHTHEHEHEHTHEHNHAHTHEHGHSHTHEHGHAHHHHHDARNLHDIIHIIEAGNLTASAKELAIHIFEIIAKAEATVHGKTIDEVHFHEVGAVDSIVDIVSFAVCLDNLHPDEVYVSPLTDGYGQIRCQHGIIPVPVPAVTAIVANEGVILKTSNVQGELVTPTGAAIAAAAATRDALPVKYRILKTGHGAGKRDYATTGILRAMMLEEVVEEQTDTVLCLETNIDDCSGETLGNTMQLLMEAGALDAFCIPIYMKKNRPAYLLKVICRASDQKAMERIIFRNTTTIGIRIQQMQRTKLDREIKHLSTPWGEADVKCCTYEGETFFYPEHDSVAALAKANQIGFDEMYHRIKSFAK